MQIGHVSGLITSNIALTMVSRAGSRLGPAPQRRSNLICSTFCRKVPAAFASLFRLERERPLPRATPGNFLPFLSALGARQVFSPRDSSPPSLLRSLQRRLLPTPISSPIHGSNDTSRRLCNNCDIVARRSRDTTLSCDDRVSDRPYWRQPTCNARGEAAHTLVFSKLFVQVSP